MKGREKQRDASLQEFYYKENLSVVNLVFEMQKTGCFSFWKAS